MSQPDTPLSGQYVLLRDRSQDPSNIPQHRLSDTRDGSPSTATQPPRGDNARYRVFIRDSANQGLPNGGNDNGEEAPTPSVPLGRRRPAPLERSPWSGLLLFDDAHVTQTQGRVERTVDDHVESLRRHFAENPSLFSGGHTSRLTECYTTHIWQTSANDTPSDATITILNKPFPSTTIPLIRDEQNPGQDKACGICHEEYEAGERMAVLPCKGMHRFHVECISEWHGHQTSKSCPFCRELLVKKEVLVGQQ